MRRFEQPPSAQNRVTKVVRRTRALERRPGAGPAIQESQYFNSTATPFTIAGNGTAFLGFQPAATTRGDALLDGDDNVLADGIYAISVVLLYLGTGSGVTSTPDPTKIAQLSVDVDNGDFDFDLLGSLPLIHKAACTVSATLFMAAGSGFDGEILNLSANTQTFEYWHSIQRIA